VLLRVTGGRLGPFYWIGWVKSEAKAVSPFSAGTDACRPSLCPVPLTQAGAARRISGLSFGSIP